jgi:hypothetical protein
VIRVKRVIRVKFLYKVNYFLLYEYLGCLLKSLKSLKSLTLLTLLKSAERLETPVPRQKPIADSQKADTDPNNPKAFSLKQ